MATGGLTLSALALLAFPQAALCALSLISFRYGRMPGRHIITGNMRDGSHVTLKCRESNSNGQKPVIWKKTFNSTGRDVAIVWPNGTSEGTDGVFGTYQHIPCPKRQNRPYQHCPYVLSTLRINATDIGRYGCVFGNNEGRITVRFNVSARVEVTNVSTVISCTATVGPCGLTTTLWFANSTYLGHMNSTGDMRLNTNRSFSSYQIVSNGTKPGLHIYDNATGNFTCVLVTCSAFGSQTAHVKTVAGVSATGVASTTPSEPIQQMRIDASSANNDIGALPFTTLHVDAGHLGPPASTLLIVLCAALVVASILGITYWLMNRRILASAINGNIAYEAALCAEGG